MKDKRRILFIVPLPPPVHGSTVVAESIKESKMINNTFECDYINITTSDSISDIGRFSLRKVWKIFCGLLKTFCLLFTKRYDLCYAAIAFHGSLFKDAPFVFLCKFFGKEVIIHLHGKGASKDAEKGIYRWMLRKTLKNTKVILLSWHLYRDVAQFVKKENVTIIPNGIPQPKENCNNRTANSIPGILFLSNLVESKGVLVLLDALKVLKGKGLSFICDFVGGETKEIDTMRFNVEVEKRGLKDMAIYRGRKYGEEKESFFEQSDVFVLPTMNDCFPLVLLEAMSHKLPCITTEEGGIADIVQDGVNGLICEKNNIMSLADCIEKLIVNRELREKMGEEGYRIMHEKFTEEVFQKNMCDTLNKASGGGILS